MTGFEVTPAFLLWLIILGLAVQSGGLFAAAYFLALARDNVRTILAILARAQEYRGPSPRELLDLSPLRDRPKRITLDEMVEGIAADAGSPTLAEAVEKTVPDPEGGNEATVGKVEVNVEARNIRLLFRRLDAAFALLRENGVSDELLERALVFLSPLEDYVEVRTGGFDERAEPIPAERMPIGQVCPDCEHDPNRRVFPMLSPTGICPNCRARWIVATLTNTLERDEAIEDPEGDSRLEAEPPDDKPGFAEHVEGFVHASRKSGKTGLQTARILEGDGFEPVRLEGEEMTTFGVDLAAGPDRTVITCRDCGAEFDPANGWVCLECGAGSAEGRNEVHKHRGGGNE